MRKYRIVKRSTMFITEFYIIERQWLGFLWLPVTDKFLMFLRFKSVEDAAKHFNNPKFEGKDVSIDFPKVR